MATNAPTPVPSQKGLERDLAKLLTVGVGRPVRGPIGDLELVAARLSDPLLPPLRQVEEVVRNAIEQFGTSSDFAVGTALVFGTHQDTAKLTKAADRRRKAADKLSVSLYTLTHDREKRMHKVLAEHLLKHYAEAGTTAVAETATAPSDEADGPTSELVVPAEDQASQPATDSTQAPTLPLPRRSRRYMALAAGVVVLLAIAIGALLRMSAPADRRASKTTRTKSASAGIAAALQPSFTSATVRLQVVVEVKLRGELQWSKSISVLPKADVLWRLGTKDVSNARLDNVVLRDVLPPHLNVVHGSVRLVDSTGDSVLADKPLFAGGFNIGNYVPGSTQYVLFDTIAQENFAGCHILLRNIGHARSDPTSVEATDWANVKIVKPSCGH